MMSKPLPRGEHTIVVHGTNTFGHDNLHLPPDHRVGGSCRIGASLAQRVRPNARLDRCRPPGGHSSTVPVTYLLVSYEVRGDRRWSATTFDRTTLPRSPAVTDRDRSAARNPLPRLSSWGREGVVARGSGDGRAHLWTHTQCVALHIRQTACERDVSGYLEVGAA